MKLLFFQWNCYFFCLKWTLNKHHEVGCTISYPPSFLPFTLNISINCFLELQIFIFGSILCNAFRDAILINPFDSLLPHTAADSSWGAVMVVTETGISKYHYEQEPPKHFLKFFMKHQYSKLWFNKCTFWMLTILF